MADVSSQGSFDDLRADVQYARAHGLAVDHTSNELLDALLLDMLQLAVPPLPTAILLADESGFDIHNTEKHIRLIKGVGETVKSFLREFDNSAPVDDLALDGQPDRISLSTNRHTNARRFKVDQLNETLFRRDDIPPKLYLERVSPFAYMGYMNLSSATYEETENPILDISNKTNSLAAAVVAEKLQIESKDIAYLSRLISSDEPEPAFLPSMHSRMSSPLTSAPRFDPLSHDFDPTAYLPPAEESFSTRSEISFSEDLGTPLTLPHDSTPSSTRKIISGSQYFSSPLLHSHKTAGRAPGFPADLATASEDFDYLSQSQPTAFALAISDGRDKRLVSQLAEHASKANSTLESEHLIENESQLRIPIPVVKALETADARRHRIANSSSIMKDAAASLEDWKRGVISSQAGADSEFTIRWKPFIGNPSVLFSECRGDSETLESAEDSRSPLDWFSATSAESVPDIKYSRSRVHDWDLSDDYPGLAALDLEAKDQSISIPRQHNEAESLDELIASRATKQQLRQSTEANDTQTTSTLFKALPVCPFDLYSLKADNAAAEKHRNQEASAPLLKEVNRHEQVHQSDVARIHTESLSKFSKVTFTPEVAIIFNTSFLTLNRQLCKDIRAVTEGLRIIERDYGTEQPDVMLSSTCAICFFTFPMILQRETDGTRSAVAHARQIALKVENLYVIAQFPLLSVLLKSKNDWDAISEFVASLAGIRVFFVKHEEDDYSDLDGLKLFTNMIKKFSAAGNGLAEEDSTVWSPEQSFG
ncbi:hypothetical protein BZA70DRAFT_265561 [Myxozyma melibiosi]|uniref:Uncharacterized protein n=1 Tax=Myxozyma melibiosi TaxID=54550 RepID=A0ABR1FEI1_9ASCO